jgi:hypothetical protein
LNFSAFSEKIGNFGEKLEKTSISNSIFPKLAADWNPPKTNMT